MENLAEQKKVLMILNPAAGRVKNKQEFWQVADHLFSAGYDVDIKTTQKAGDAHCFAARYGADCDLLVSCGGDGTLNEVVGGMTASCVHTPLCHLPLGTTNDMARTLRLPKNLQEIADLTGNQAPIPMDAGLLNNQQLFTYVAAFGMFTDTACLTPQALKNKLGYSAYLLGALRALMAIRPCEVAVSTDTNTYRGNFLYGCVSNSTSIGRVFHLDKEPISLSDGRLELLLVRAPESPAQWPRLLSNIVSSRFDGDQLILESTRQAHFEFKESIAWTVDGESAGSFRSVDTGVKRHAYQIYGNAPDARPQRRKQRAREALAQS